MKLNLKKCISLVLAIFLVAMTFGCAFGESTPGRKFKIAYALKTVQEEFWQSNRDELRKAAEAAGCEFIVQVANNDSSLQISQIENLLTQGIDLLIITAVDGGAVTSILDSVRARGIPVLNYDQVLINAYSTVFVGYKNEKIGTDIASKIAEMNIDGNYVFLYGDRASGQNIIDISEGMKLLFADRIADGRVNIVMEQFCREWKAEEGQAHMENALSANNNNIQAVLAMNDGIASGAINALESQGLAGQVPVVGMDGELTALQRIVQGTQTSTLFKPAKLMAEIAIETAMKMLNNEPLDTDQTISFGVNDMPWVIADGIVVDKNNIDEVVIGGGYFTREQIYR